MPLTVTNPSRTAVRLFRGFSSRLGLGGPSALPTFRLLLVTCSESSSLTAICQVFFSLWGFCGLLLKKSAATLVVDSVKTRVLRGGLHIGQVQLQAALIHL